MKFEPIQYVSNVNVYVTSIQHSHKQCSGKILECTDLNENDNSNCSLPFDNVNDNSICTEYDEGLEVVKTKLYQMQNCQKKCLQLEINYNEKPNK